MRLVASGLAQQRFDLREHLLRLSGDVGLGIGGDLPSEIRSSGRPIDHELRKAFADVPAFDDHGAILN